jgi:hypothetical protein
MSAITTQTMFYDNLTNRQCIRPFTFTLNKGHVTRSTTWARTAEALKNFDESEVHTAFPGLVTGIICFLLFALSFYDSLFS